VCAIFTFQTFIYRETRDVKPGGNCYIYIYIYNDVVIVTEL